MKYIRVLFLALIGMLILGLNERMSSDPDPDSLIRRKKYLKQLFSALSPDYMGWAEPPRLAMNNKTLYPQPTPIDSTWTSWVNRSGELPPDFHKMPSLTFLPDPMIIDEGGKNIPVRTLEQWEEKREWLKEQTEYWITGSVPPAPGNLKFEILAERRIGDFTEKDILLKFGPNHAAQLHITLLIPPGKGPFPVVICPWMKDGYNWIQTAVRRGYIGVRYRANEPAYGYPDDSEEYAKIWWPEYDFSTIMRWGWSASRTIDYLYTLSYVNKEHIALTGLSRNGKQALWAAAQDERIKAVVPISGGTGGENPFRYTADKYNNETMELLTRFAPHWFHPRLRFFVGRENKLPVDQNSLMAMIAPRGLMLTSSITETAGNPWGIEQAYLSAKKVYDFLGAGDHIAIDLRQGLHAPSPSDMEKYVDFFDYVFGRGKIKPDNKLYYNYSFSRWKKLSGEDIDPLQYKINGQNNLLQEGGQNQVVDLKGWEKKKGDIIDRIKWGLGEEPVNLGPVALGPKRDYMRTEVGLPSVKKDLESEDIFYGQLYYPEGSSDTTRKEDLPVVVYLHEYSYSKGFATGRRGQQIGEIIHRFTDQGYAVYVFDLIGFGSRIEEGRLFYERFPRWSKMGSMVTDVRSAIDELSELEYVNKDKVFVAGYSLGATVGLYTAALDGRIAGVISVGGFSPMRTDYAGKTAEGIYGYSHLHGLLPRLGFFAGHEPRIPYDFHEILALIAPRPLLVVAPTWDQFASLEDIKQTIQEVNKVISYMERKMSIFMLPRIIIDFRQV
jgi:dienelactone hydrolase